MQTCKHANMQANMQIYKYAKTAAPKKGRSKERQSLIGFLMPRTEYKNNGECIFKKDGLCSRFGFPYLSQTLREKNCNIQAVSTGTLGRIVIHTKNKNQIIELIDITYVVYVEVNAYYRQKNTGCQM